MKNKEEITELDKKYLVLKWDDIEKLPLNDFLMATALCNQVKQLRRNEGKPDDNQYVVLNLADQIDLHGLITRLQSVYASGDMGSSRKYARHRLFKMKDIAVELVNSIMRVK